MRLTIRRLAQSHLLWATVAVDLSKCLEGAAADQALASAERQMAAAQRLADLFTATGS